MLLLNSKELCFPATLLELRADLFGFVCSTRLSSPGSTGSTYGGTSLFLIEPSRGSPGSQGSQAVVLEGAGV